MLVDRQDILYAIRSARRTPLLSSIAVGALALGIGLNTGVFTLLNTLFLEAPTRVAPSRFVQIYPRYEGWFTGAGQYSTFTTEDYDAIHMRTHTLEDVAAWQASSATLGQESKRVGTMFISCNYFHVFGIDRPLQGRFLSPDECRSGATAQVAVLSETFWRAAFAQDPQMVGKTIHLNGVPMVVVGIISADAANFLPGGIFIPYTLQPLLERNDNLLRNPDAPWLSVAGRLRNGFSRLDAETELATIVGQQDRSLVERQISAFNRKTSLVLTNGSFVENPAFHDRVLALMVLILGPLSLVVLLACVNVTMLSLSRTILRRGEIAVRLALGVGRARLARMLLFESLLTAVVAGAISILLAYRVPLLVMNAADPGWSTFVPLMRPNWHIFAYLSGLVAVATVTSSLVPMRAAWNVDLLTALKGQEGAATVRSGTTNGLIIVQIAMSFVLLAAAVLFVRIPGMVMAMDPGFETRHTLAVPLSVDTSPNAQSATLTFYQALESRLLTIPGVQSLAYESLQPFRQPPPSEIRLQGQMKGNGRPASVDDVSVNFFSTFDIRLIAGRVFVLSDVTSTHANAVALVSQAFAKQFWPGIQPVGRVIVTADDRRWTVVGVVADTRSERFGVLDGPRLYTLSDPTAPRGTLYVRFAGDVETVRRAVRDAAKSLDPTQTESPETIWESLVAEAESMRSLARIILIMASIALVMAIIGVYGVLSFAVNQRTREFGIRMVLGADRIAIFRSILLRGSRQIAIGLVCGIALAEQAEWALARMLKNSNIALRSLDGSVYAITVLVLVAASCAAMYLPALRATQVDPIKSLRTN
jgi:predicted permease